MLRLARSHADLTAAARSDGSTALHMAVLCQRIDVIEALLDAGAPLEAKARSDTTALHCAAMQGHTQTLRYLLDKHASLNARTVDGETPLHLAVKTNNLNCAVMLVGSGADTDCTRNDGSTILHLCAISGNVEMARQLVRAGANPALVSSPCFVHGLQQLSIARTARFLPLPISPSKFTYPSATRLYCLLMIVWPGEQSGRQCCSAGSAVQPHTCGRSD